MANWVGLGEYWGALRDLAQQRHGQKKGFRSSNLWTKKHNTHFYGLCGEALVAMANGWKVDRSLRVSGDPGYDFEVDGHRYDVKTATFWTDPHIKEFPDKELQADTYILVGLDVSRKRGYIVGWASKEQIAQAQPRDYGHGQMRAVTKAEIDRWGQVGMPPVIPEMM